MSNIKLKLQNRLLEYPVVLFMKGTRAAPQCGFSAVVVQILTGLSIDFLDIDVLSDYEIRQGIKVFSNWPTIPQLYIKGEFIGGCDIVRELYQSGELYDILSNHCIAFENLNPPTA